MKDNSGFSLDRLQRIGRMESRHFWFVGRRAVAERLLDKHSREATWQVLDLGCGTGMMANLLEERGHRVVALDLRPEGLAAIRTANPRLSVVQADVTKLPLANACCDLVLLLDVLEHADDRRVMAEVFRVLRPGGIALATVPAMPWLWSRRDEAAGHLRRYARRPFTVLLENAGLRVEEMLYYQCLLFPPVVITRLLGRFGNAPADMEERPIPVLNALLCRISRLEVILGRIIRWPWGSTLAAVCRKV